MESAELRVEDLQSLRSKAHEYFMNVNRPVLSGELAAFLFRQPGRDHSSVAPMLIRTLLKRDDRFHELRKNTWDLVHPPYADQLLSETSFVVVDLEATGSNLRSDHVIEVALVRVRNLEIQDRFTSLVNPEVAIPQWIRRLTGIDSQTVENAPRLHQLAPELLEYLSGCIFVAHNVDFDYPFLRSQLMVNGFNPSPWPRVCTVRLARRLFPEIGSYRLDYLARHFGIEMGRHHRAMEDAQATALVLLHLIERMRSSGLKTVGDLMNHSRRG